MADDWGVDTEDDLPMQSTKLLYRKFKINSHDWRVAKLLCDGKTREEVIRTIFPLVGAIETFTYKSNEGGIRVAKSLADQRKIVIYKVNQVVVKLKKEGWVDPEPYISRQRWESKESQWVRYRRNFINKLIEEQDHLSDELEPDPPPDIYLPKPRKSFSVLKDEYLKNVYDIAPEKETEVIIKEELPPDELDEYNRVIARYEHNSFGKALRVAQTIYAPTTSQKLDYFYKQMMKARSFVLKRELAGQYLDFISTRALKDGCNAISCGVGVHEVMIAVTKTWPQDSKDELKNWTENWFPGPNRGINPNDYASPLPNSHRLLGYIYCLAQARVPIFLVGPSGSGKSFLARDLADAFNTEYGELPLTAGATPSWLVGAETITGYKTRPFVEIYEHGGVFCFEEMDAADPNMLLLVNNAIANQFLTNPVTGKEIPKHSDFIPVATANTWGLGANRQFTGRERLDAATLDRWRVGRVELDYDQKIEQAIVDDYKSRAEQPKIKKAIK